MGMAGMVRKKQRQDPDQLSGTAGADGKLPAAVKKRPVRPAMAAEKDRQPFVKPCHVVNACSMPYSCSE